MNNLITVLDFLSRAMAILLAVGTIIGFISRKWISAWIDARFKKQLDSELATIQHDFSVSLEEKKAALSRELEGEKHALSEEFRRKTIFFNRMLNYIEVFDIEYGKVISELYALEGNYMDKLKELDGELAVHVRKSYLLNAHALLMKAQEKLEQHSVYIDNSNLLVRSSQLFADLSSFMAAGAHDRKTLDALSFEAGVIKAELKYDLKKI